MSAIAPAPPPTPGPRRRFFSVYQYVVPLTLFPLSYWLWLRRQGGHHELVWYALSIPVLFAYVIPGLGTNRLGLWEINTGLRLGRFRPHHGFVFGTAAGLFALACLPARDPSAGVAECLRAAFVVGAVVGFWNWYYDIEAIKSGFIVLHSRLAAEGHPAEVVATDHAPVLFGTFGACYGAAIRAGDALLAPGSRAPYWAMLLIANLVTLVVPVLAYVGVSYLRWGESGLKVHSAPMKRGRV